MIPSPIPMILNLSRALMIAVCVPSGRLNIFNTSSSFKHIPIVKKLRIITYFYKNWCIFPKKQKIQYEILFKYID